MKKLLVKGSYVSWADLHKRSVKQSMTEVLAVGCGLNCLLQAMRHNPVKAVGLRPADPIPKQNRADLQDGVGLYPALARDRDAFVKPQLWILM